MPFRHWLLNNLNVWVTSEKFQKRRFSTTNMALDVNCVRNFLVGFFHLAICRTKLRIIDILFVGAFIFFCREKHKQFEENFGKIHFGNVEIDQFERSSQYRLPWWTCLELLTKIYVDSCKEEARSK